MSWNGADIAWDLVAKAPAPTEQPQLLKHEHPPIGLHVVVGGRLDVAGAPLAGGAGIARVHRVILAGVAPDHLTGVVLVEFYGAPTGLFQAPWWVYQLEHGSIIPHDTEPYTSLSLAMQVAVELISDLKPGGWRYPLRQWPGDRPAQP